MPLQTVVLRSRSNHLLIWTLSIAILATWAVVVVAPGANPSPLQRSTVGLVGVGVVLAFHRATRMRIELSDDAVTLFGYISTERVEWHCLSDVSVDYYGLRLVRTDGVVLTAYMMGKSNWSALLHRRTAADARVELIRSAMARHRDDESA